MNLLMIAFLIRTGWNFEFPKKPKLGNCHCIFDASIV
jgi:hypothetical protein